MRDPHHICGREWHSACTQSCAAEEDALRFLLVEDNEIVADGVAMALTDEGHQVVISHTGGAVPFHVERDRPDVAVIDVSLPDIDGVTVARRLRHDIPDLPIVFTTGWDHDPGLRDAASELRARVLQKPFEITSLLDTLEPRGR